MTKGRPVKKVFQLIFENGSCCRYCERELEWEEITVDHIVPKFRGGKDDIENLAIACQSCNSSKGIKTLDEFHIHKSLKEVIPDSKVSFGPSGLNIQTGTQDLEKNIEILQKIVARLGVLSV